MEALLAIAMLCQVSAQSVLGGLDGVDRHQLSCQQKYIKCYEEKLSKEDKAGQIDPKVWYGKLKSCVLERVGP